MAATKWPFMSKFMKYFKSLKKNWEFQKIYKTGKSFANKFLIMYVTENNTDSNNLGITVSKKVGNSVVRHRVTRLIKENFRLQEMIFNSGLNIVVVARASTSEASCHDIGKAVLHLAKLHKIIKK